MLAVARNHRENLPNLSETQTIVTIYIVDNFLALAYRMYRYILLIQFAHDNLLSFK